MSFFLFLELLTFSLAALLAGSDRSGPPTPNETFPYWLQNATYQTTRTGALSQNSDYDIVIIGAGMTGASTLYHLTQNLNSNPQYVANVLRKRQLRRNANQTTLDDTVNILILDSRGAAGGATGRNGGGLGFVRAGTFVSTLNTYGEDEALKQYNYSMSNYRNLMDYMESKSNLENTFQTGYYLSPLLYNDTVEWERERRIFVNEYGLFYNATLLDHQTTIDTARSYDDTYQISEYGGNSTYFWPARVVQNLINDSVYASNNEISGNTEYSINLDIQFLTTVLSVTRNEDESVTIETDQIDLNGNNIKLTSGVVVYATNGYTSFLLEDYENKIVPTKNQVIMSEPWDYYIWDNMTAGSGDYEGYNYWDQSLYTNRILIGGGRLWKEDDNYWVGNYNDSYVDQNVSINLQNYLSGIYPEINDADGIKIYMEWQGIMGFSDDYMPRIGPLEKNNSVEFICAGFTGNGMANTFEGGRVLADMIVGEQTVQPFPDIYLPYYPGRN